LILFKAASEDIGGNHACWDETEEVLTYKETRLGMDQVPVLLQSEYKRAAHLLGEELMLGRRGLLPMKAWLLKDRPDVSTFGWHLGHHIQNHTLLEGCSTALIRAIGESTTLKRIYVQEHAGDEETPSLRWREKGIAVYEASTHEFLKSLAVLVHMSNQPIREPEFFSMTWRNTEKRRAIMLMHDRVMVHTTYDKTQQQRSKFRDSIRFLPAPVGSEILIVKCDDGSRTVSSVVNGELSSTVRQAVSNELKYCIGKRSHALRRRVRLERRITGKLTWLNSLPCPAH
jgi:ribosomal protein S17